MYTQKGEYIMEKKYNLGNLIGFRDFLIDNNFEFFECNYIKELKKIVVVKTDERSMILLVIFDNVGHLQCMFPKAVYDDAYTEYMNSVVSASFQNGDYQNITVHAGTNQYHYVSPLAMK